MLERLRALLATELAAVTATHTGHGDPTAALEDGVDGAPHLPRASGPRELAADYLRIATTGLYDTGRYRSPSEARQAVLAAAVSAGLTLPQVLTRIDTGVWPGLASFYTRYRHRQHPAEGAARGLAQRGGLHRRQTREEPHAEPCA